MDLSRVVAKSFAEVANKVNENKKEGVTYATIVEYNGTLYAKLDGSSILTPISSTVNITNGDRVIVMLKNHVAVITGNLSDPSASGQAVTEIGSKVVTLNNVVADKVNTKELEAEKARIDSLEADNVTVNEKLTAVEADIGTLTADNATINGKLTAAEADIDNLTAENATINGKISANSAEIGTLKSEFGDFKQLTTDNFTATNAEIENLKTEKLSAEQADLRYANIEFSNIGDAAINNLYAKSGIIENLVVENGTVVTGELVGVTIKGDLIEGGTIVADKLVVKGSDGLYYKLNTDGVSIEAEQTEYNSLNGSIITAKSITATKINVSDLVAFDATIGGFNISDSSIYSGVKSSVDNSTRGIYLDKNGQINFGDSTNYLKFFKDADNNWKLAISADQMIMSSSGKSVEEAINEVEVGGRNYIRNSKNLSNFTIDDSTHISTELTDESITVTRLTSGSYYGIYYDVNVNSNTEYTFSFEVLSVTGTCHYSIGNTTDWSKFVNKTLIEGTGRKSVTFTVPSDVTKIRLYISIPTVDVSVTVCNAKFELGNRATDWTPAPEDVDHAITSGNDEIREVMTEQNLSVISDCESMIVSALESYVETSNYEEFRQEVSSQLEILASELNLRFTETTEQIETINGEMQSQLNTITKYFTFDINGLTIGQVDSPYKVVINNDRYSMLVNGVEVMWISNGEVHTPELSITDRFRLLGLLFEIDDSGNINCEWVGIPLTITSQPQGILITTPGTYTVTFSVGAIGMKLTYQWQYRTFGTNTWNNVTGDGNSVSTTVQCDPPSYVEGAGTVDHYFVRYYRCIITDIDGNQVTTNEVSLTYDSGA